MEIYILFAALLVAFALGGVFMALLAGGGAQGPIVVMQPAAPSDSGIGCALMMMLGAVAFIVLLMLCGNLPPGGL